VNGSPHGHIVQRVFYARGTMCRQSIADTYLISKPHHQPSMKSLTTSTLLNALFVAVIALGSSVATAYQPVGTLLSATGLADPVRQPSVIGSMDDFQDGSDAASNGQTPGNVSELKQMVQAHKLTELRVTYNGNYGAALFFYPQEMVYYVALFQDKKFLARREIAGRRAR